MIQIDLAILAEAGHAWIIVERLRLLSAALTPFALTSQWLSCFGMPFQCDQQPHVAKHHRGTKKHQNGRSRTRVTHKLPFIAGCSHFTRKHVSRSGILPKRSPTQHSYSHYNAFCIAKWRTACIYAPLYCYMQLIIYCYDMICIVVYLYILLCYVLLCYVQLCYI